MALPHTLTQFVIDQHEPELRQGTELADLLTTIALGVKYLSRMVASTGMPQIDVGDNVSETTEETTNLPLDQKADAILVDLLSESGHLGLLVSETRDSVVATAVSQLDSEFVVVLDPLDGMSNLGSNIPVGTCFAILKKKEHERQAVLDDFMQTGRGIVAAGYAIYGPRTDFVCSLGKGVHSFTLDSNLGEFLLTETNLRMPTSGPWFSVNEGYSKYWDQKVNLFIDEIKSRESEGRPVYLGRYIGSLVADFDRTLRHGGIFLHPKSSIYPEGKLRLLYECMPLAFLAEQAGGVALSDQTPVLDKQPKDIHDRSDLILGSPREMSLYKELVC